ncbi:unnamed protein product [Cyclocybe aegerita]|uniref:Uncharacterized protein n=1 Tax=Cyclocybe aegerita TaxID=1973307 RepID=A0A8S0WZA2_CYCAE|nr:unnamed protein product [Cyclocybe aegerita]
MYHMRRPEPQVIGPLAFRTTSFSLNDSKASTILPRSISALNPFSTIRSPMTSSCKQAPTVATCCRPSGTDTSRSIKPSRANQYITPVSKRSFLTALPQNRAPARTRFEGMTSVCLGLWRSVSFKTSSSKSPRHQLSRAESWR